MMEHTCTANDCNDPVGRKGAKGLCPKHYRKLRRYGDPNYVKPTYAQCQVSGCHKPPRSTHADLCAMHYHRMYRDGGVGEPEARKAKHRQPHCIIDGCTDPDEARGLCAKHDARLRRNGDPLRLIPVSDRNLARGTGHHAWRGDEVGYVAAHDRVRRQHGSAKDHQCIDCGNTAAHWTYDHMDANEQHYEYKPGMFAAYSPNPEHYSPRCVPCHKAFDLYRIDSAKHQYAG